MSILLYMFNFSWRIKLKLAGWNKCDYIYFILLKKGKCGTDKIFFSTTFDLTVELSDTGGYWCHEHNIYEMIK